MVGKNCRKDTFSTDRHENSCRSFLPTLLAGILLIILSCNKDETVNAPPRIEFITDGGYLSADTILSVGTRVMIGIRASGTNRNITYFHIGFDNGSPLTVLDSGMNRPGFDYRFQVIKTDDSTETWSFLVMDRDRNRSCVSLRILRAETTKWGNIRALDNVTLGAQSSFSAGSFCSLLSGATWFLPDAFLRQDSVDMIYYYGSYEATMSSPAEAEAPIYFTGPPGIANWTVKNESRYDTTAISPAAFDASHNDSLLLLAYEPADLKRKAKYLAEGMVVSFQDIRGKIGLFKVNSVEAGDSGKVNISIKIQE